MLPEMNQIGSILGKERKGSILAASLADILKYARKRHMLFTWNALALDKYRTYAHVSWMYVVGRHMNMLIPHLCSKILRICLELCHEQHIVK